MVDIFREATGDVERKIYLGFPGALSQSEPLYRRGFQGLIEQTLINGAPDENAKLVLVEPRISFDQQARLLNIDLDPALLYHPRHNRNRRPYAAWVIVAPTTNGESLAWRIDHLSTGWKPVTPFEGLGLICGHGFPQDQVSLAVPSGKHDRVNALTGNPDLRHRTLVIERYLEGIRVGQRRLTEVNSWVGILAAHR